jgi:hypothetical protein
MRNSKLIALLLPESPDQHAKELGLQTATALVRDHEGRMSLHPFTKDMPFADQAMTTGCFRRGKAIIDPVSREVMGYEMEMLEDTEMGISQARLQLSH